MPWPELIAPPMYDNPAEGWEDTKLPNIIKIWEVAKSCGYAVGIHGSLKRDFDLIAAPWMNQAAVAFCPYCGKEGEERFWN